MYQMIPNQNGNLEIKTEDGVIELFLGERCPRCNETMGDHLGIFCRYFETLTLDQFIKNGFAHKITKVVN